jgi:hypothetical protein
MTRPLLIVAMLAAFYAPNAWANTERLGIVVEIHSPKLSRKVYPGLAETMIAPAIAAQLIVRFAGDKRNNIEPTPPFDQWNLVAVTDRRSGPANCLIFSIDEKSEAMRLRLSFVSANGRIDPPLTAEWRRPGDTSPYPSRSTAGADFADLFITEIIDKQFQAVIEHLSSIPLATGRWQPSTTVLIALPLPAERHTQLRGSSFRIFGQWEQHERGTEIGDVEVFADGTQERVKSKWFEYDALGATWNDNSSAVSYERFRNCKCGLYFQTVYLEHYRIPSSARVTSP